MQGDSIGRKYTVTTLTPAPPSLIPKSNKKLKLLDIDPLELARQLTLLESKQYNAIKPIECLARARDEPAENDSIKAIITTTNKIASWVAFSVLEKEEPRRRGNTIKHFIHVAEVSVWAPLDLNSTLMLRTVTEMPVVAQLLDHGRTDCGFELSSYSKAETHLGLGPG
jgi:hypothetical protein